MDTGVALCAYCGVIADTEDHVVPRHWLARAQELRLDSRFEFGMRRAIVPACRECNSGLSGQLYPTMERRRAAAHARLRRKYKAVLSIPDWTKEELAAMTPEARCYIRQGIRKRDQVRERLRWRGAVRYAVEVSDVLAAIADIASQDARCKPTGSGA